MPADPVCVRLTFNAFVYLPTSSSLFLHLSHTLPPSSPSLTMSLYQFTLLPFSHSLPSSLYPHLFLTLSSSSPLLSQPPPFSIFISPSFSLTWVSSTNWANCQGSMKHKLEMANAHMAFLLGLRVLWRDRCGKGQEARGKDIHRHMPPLTLPFRLPLNRMYQPPSPPLTLTALENKLKGSNSRDFDSKWIRLNTKCDQCGNGTNNLGIANIRLYKPDIWTTMNWDHNNCRTLIIIYISGSPMVFPRDPNWTRLSQSRINIRIAINNRQNPILKKKKRMVYG